MIEENNKIIDGQGKKINYLLDTSVIRLFELLHKHTGASIFIAISEIGEVNFFITNEVFSELMNGPDGFDPSRFKPLLGHVLNAESSMSHGHKENKFLIEEDGETKYIVLNKISRIDYGQILLTQNHPQLTLVTNDRKMLKSGAQVILGKRIIGIPAFLDRLIGLDPSNERLLLLKKSAEELFAKKHAFGKP